MLPRLSAPLRAYTPLPSACFVGSTKLSPTPWAVEQGITMDETSPPGPQITPHNVLDGWLSREELGAQLGLSPSTLKRWEGSRTGPPCVRVGRRIVYRLEAVRDWLREQEARKQPKSGGRR